MTRRICMITHSFYESDNRVLRYAETLARRGDCVDVVALRRNPGTPKIEVLNGVTVHRLQDRFGKPEKSRLSFLGPVLKFLAVSSVWLTRRHLRSRYDLIHVHNIPDFLVFAAWLPKLTGAGILLDIHDIVPEFYATKFKTGVDSWGIKALRLAERVSARFADHVILANDLWLNKYVGRSATPGKCSVFINNVDSELFRARPRNRKDGRLIILFPGGLQWHQGIDIAIQAMPAVLERLPNARFHIYGDGNMKDELVLLRDQLGLAESVRFFNPLPVSQIAEIMSQADLGVVPKRANSFGNEAYSTKIMEFMSLKVPVVASSTRIERFYFDDTLVRFFESGNPDALAKAIVDVLQDDEMRRKMVDKAAEYAIRHSWQRRQNAYLNLVDALIEKRTLPIRPDMPDGHFTPSSPATTPVMRSDPWLSNNAANLL